MSRRRTRTRALGPREGAGLSPVATAPGVGGVDFGFASVREPFSGAWQMNKECTAQTALAFSGVYACVMTIADDVSKLPVRVREFGADEIARTKPDHWAARLFRKPNSYQTGIQFLQQYVLGKLLTGTAYVIFEYDDRQVPIAMHLLDPRTTRPLIADDGDIYYSIAQSHSNINALAGIKGDVILPATDVLHDRMASVFHPLIGVSPLFAAGASAQTGYSILQNSKSFFANMSRTSGVLTAPGKISKETAARLAQKWRDNFSAGNIGQVAVLGDGLKWEPMTLSAVDAQLIEQLRWSVEDVARVFRVPMFMLGDLSKVSYKNSEQLARTYYQSTLQWHLESIESAFDKFFDFTRTTFLEFDLDPLFRTDSESRFSVYKDGLDAGVYAINEVRARENLPPVKGGSEPRIQMQYVPISIPPAPPAPPAPDPADPPQDPDDDPDDPDDEDIEELSAIAWTQRMCLEFEGAANA